MLKAFDLPCHDGGVLFGPPVVELLEELFVLLPCGFSGEAERVRSSKAETLKTETLKSQQRAGFAGADTAAQLQRNCGIAPIFASSAANALYQSCDPSLRSLSPSKPAWQSRT